MVHMSQREAARAWGLSRATVQRAIKAGKLSATGDKLIDPSEMVRAFGEPKSRPDGRLNEPLEATNEQGVGQAELARIAALEAENRGLRELLASKDAHLIDLRSQVQLLSHDRPGQRRRWWQF